MIQGALDADGRIAAKNAVKIRAALHQVTDFKRVFQKYQETQPQATDNPTQDRARARAWVILNVYLNDEPLDAAIKRSWAEAYVLGQAAAGEWIAKTKQMQKADQSGIDWDNWQPGDQATALLLKPYGGFAKFLEQSGGATFFKKFDKETIENLGTALSDSIAAGLDAERAAIMIGRHVASPARALTIAITEQNRAMSFGSIQRYKEAELEKMEWHVSDPCDKCAQNSGQVVVIGQAFNSGNNQPPAHPHCRCVLLPVIPGMEEPGITEGTVTSPTVTPNGTIQQEAFTPGSAGKEEWKKVDEDRWIARQEALRLQRGLPPANEYHLRIMRDQVKDAKVIYERGPHIIMLDNSVKTVTDAHLEAVMRNFDIAYEKLPEWRRFAPDGTAKGYTLIINNRSPGADTLAYTYLGHDSIWISPKDASSSLADIKDFGSWFMPAASTTNQNLYTIMHEFGHTVDHIDNEGVKGKVRSKVIRKYKDLFSRYGRKSQEESYAEVFAQWALGEQNPVTEAYAKTFGWDLTASEYYEQIPKDLQWKPNYRSPGTIGGF